VLGQGVEPEVGGDEVLGGPLDHVAARRRDLRQHRPAVVGVRAAVDQARGLEPPDDRGHRRGVHLEPLPHLAERQRAARGEHQQHQRLVAREGQPVGLEDAVEPPDHQLLDAHQRGDGVHRGDAVPVLAPLPGGLVDRVEREGHSVAF
jgi:hypothetical protein